MPSIADVLVLPPAIMVEGPIELLDDATLVVYGISFDFSYTPELVMGYSEGDMVAIEGAVNPGDGTFIIISIAPAESSELPRPSLTYIPETGQSESESTEGAEPVATDGEQLADNTNPDTLVDPSNPLSDAGSSDSPVANPPDSGSDGDGNNDNSCDGDGNSGHGNNPNNEDCDNPGKGNPTNHRREPGN
jgi:hypothetical protein